MPRLEELDLDRLCNFIWFRLIDGREEADIAKLRAQIWMPPKGVEVVNDRSPWSAENELGALNALKAQLGARTD